MESGQIEKRGAVKERIQHLRSNLTETEKVILSRRSVRWYRNEEVPEFMIRRILEAGRYAPSAGNSQPWKFVVVRDQNIIDGLTKTVVSICKFFKWLLEFRTPGNYWKLPIAKLFIRLLPAKLHPVPFSAVSLIADGKLGLYHGAKTVILIFKDVRGVTNPDMDCGIAGQNMVVAAHSMGLGTCWVSFVSLAFDYTRQWEKKFRVQYPYKFVSSIAIGWPMGSPDGMVERATHRVEWFENGTRMTIDEVDDDNRIGFMERHGIPDYSNPSHISHGKVSFNYDVCNGCGTCARICPANSIEIADNKPRMRSAFDGECMACGDCRAICQKEAITVFKGYRYSKMFKTIDHGKPCFPRLK